MSEYRGPIKHKLRVVLTFLVDLIELMPFEKERQERAIEGLELRRAAPELSHRCLLASQCNQECSTPSSIKLLWLRVVCQRTQYQMDIFRSPLPGRLTSPHDSQDLFSLFLIQSPANVWLTLG